jgi:hypothetical protein
VVVGLRHAVAGVSLKLAWILGVEHGDGVVHVSYPVGVDLITMEAYFHMEVLMSEEVVHPIQICNPHPIQTCTHLGVVHDPHYPMNCLVHLVAPEWAWFLTELQID